MELTHNLARCCIQYHMDGSHSNSLGSTLDTHSRDGGPVGTVSAGIHRTQIAVKRR